jgi:leucyl aminopeptidase
MSLIAQSNCATPLYLIDAKYFDEFLVTLNPAQIAWLKNSAFKASPGQHTLIADAQGRLEKVVMIGRQNDLYALSALPKALPAGAYALQNGTAETIQALALGWLLGCDRFDRYKKQAAIDVQLVVANESVRARAHQLSEAVCSARAMVNTPAEDLGPAELSAIMQKLAAAHQAQFSEIVGDDLLRENFPAIHAVGRASHRPPRLLSLEWGNPSHPRVILIGKGVCFDTGGLDMKAADGMALMKKDMGGSAVAIQLAKLVMQAKLSVHLQLYVPAVENAVGPQSYRPGDVINTRSGQTVEIGNTDAEGRVILCDALTLAVEQKPALILDFATLTGAARIALGPDLPATFSHDEEVAHALISCGEAVQDPLWRMPLWADYQRMIDSAIADMNNAGSGRMAGAITAALYLERFVPHDIPWVHIDTYCWNDVDKPGRPKGGACQSLRAAFCYLETRFG